MPEIIKRKIVVNVGFFEFVFDDLIAANAFAYVAKSHLAEDLKGHRVSISVDYEGIEEEQDDQTTD